jgi:hypothetical protein|tara:strand:- start:833 stop:1057 length:225 start_codon:yes stop_codon:yes gene_type:complete
VYGRIYEEIVMKLRQWIEVCDNRMCQLQERVEHLENIIKENSLSFEEQLKEHAGICSGVDYESMAEELIKKGRK